MNDEGTCTGRHTITDNGPTLKIPVREVVTNFDEKLSKEDAAALRAVSRSSRKIRRAFAAERRKGKLPTEALRNIRRR